MIEISEDDVKEVDDVARDILQFLEEGTSCYQWDCKERNTFELGPYYLIDRYNTCYSNKHTSDAVTRLLLRYMYVSREPFYSKKSKNKRNVHGHVERLVLSTYAKFYTIVVHRVMCTLL